MNFTDSMRLVEDGEIILAVGTILKSKQAHDSIASWIRSGKYVTGDRLPSEKKIAMMLEMSHLSVRSGMEVLRKAGIIEKRPRVGNFVNGAHPAELSTQIAVAVPLWLMQGSSQQPTFSLLMNGLHGQVDQRKFSMANLVYRPDNFWLDAGQVMLDRGVEGVVLFPEESVSRSDVERLLDAGLRIVLAKTSPAMIGLGLFSVTWDRAAVASKIFDRLLELGHRDVVVAGYEHGDFEDERSVMRMYHETKGLGLGEDYFVEIPNDRTSLDISVLESFFQRKTTPTAIVVPDEMIANEVFRLCYRRNLRVPENVSVAAMVDMTPDSHPIELTAMDSVSQLTQAAMDLSALKAAAA